MIAYHRGVMEAAKPVLLTVDDDPGVSRAVARDLRRHYGQDYRVVRAESGPQALEALREIKLRGDAVAVLLADYRMPVMSGLEFLEQAMDLFPHARRALLTAYADTDAAIQAINVVDLDHYLLKSFEVRDFLARNSVPYRWFTVEQPEGQRLLDAARLDATGIPLVVTPDGESLVDPSVEQLAARVGLSTTPATDFYDTVIVGGGPAGLGAAVYAASEGLRTVLVERQATGGQAGQSSRIENYLGFPDGVSGGQLTDRARRQAHKFGAEVLTARSVAGLEARGSSRVIRFADGSEVAAHTVVLATGVAYHRLEVPGADRLTGLGVFYGSAATEAPACAGEDVYVVGGGNAAGQAAVFLSRHARRVTLLVRADGLEQSMSYYLIRQIRESPKVEVRLNTQVVRVAGQEHLERLSLCDTRDGTVAEVASSFLFVFIGAAPCTEWLDGVIDRDPTGFLLTGPDLLVSGKRPIGWPLDRDPYYLEGSVPGIFAAGDVRANSVKRVASAVGEGAMAIQLVHRYLEAP